MFGITKTNKTQSVNIPNSTSFNKTNALARACSLCFAAISASQGVKDVRDMFAHRKDTTDANGTVIQAKYTTKQQLQKGALAAAKIGAGTLVAYKAVK